jgi:hypothetical protein
MSGAQSPCLAFRSGAGSYSPSYSQYRYLIDTQLAWLFPNITIRSTEKRNASIAVRSKMRHVLADIKSVPVVCY